MHTLNLISIVAIIIGAFQCVVIVYDTIVYRQTMPIMSFVWPLIGLYFPILGIWAYYLIGKKDARNKEKSSAHAIEHHQAATHSNHMKRDDQHSHHQHALHQSHASQTPSEHINHQENHQMHHTNKPFWQSVLVSTTHCTGGCALGDMIGPPIVYFSGITLLGSTLFSDYVLEFVLAFVLGIVFQYYGMNHGNHKPTIIEAIKTDALSLIAFEIGMFGWMALVHEVFFTSPPNVTSPIFWFMMQVAMLVGFITSFPANWLLIKKGMMHRM